MPSLSPIEPATTSPQQAEFDAKYITAQEIMQDIGVTRPALKYARDRKLLPPPIVLAKGTLLVWVRTDVSEYLAAWKKVLETRRKGV
jgi:predicted DNA-binding transcriptional regulator AlpA